MRYRLGVAVLILSVFLAGALRPIIKRAIDPNHEHLGLKRITFVSEPVTNVDPSPPAPPRTHIGALIAALSGPLSVTAKSRLVPFIPIPVRRLKIPARTARSLLSD